MTPLCFTGSFKNFFYLILVNLLDFCLKINFYNLISFKKKFVGLFWICELIPNKKYGQVFFSHSLKDRMQRYLVKAIKL